MTNAADPRELDSLLVSRLVRDDRPNLDVTACTVDDLALGEVDAVALVGVLGELRERLAAGSLTGELRGELVEQGMRLVLALGAVLAEQVTE